MERYTTIADRMDESWSNKFLTVYYSIGCFLIWRVYVGMFYLWTNAMARNDKCWSNFFVSFVFIYLILKDEEIEEKNGYIE